MIYSLHEWLIRIVKKIIISTKNINERQMLVNKRLLELCNHLYQYGSLIIDFELVDFDGYEGILQCRTTYTAFNNTKKIYKVEARIGPEFLIDAYKNKLLLV